MVPAAHREHNEACDSGRRVPPSPSRRYRRGTPPPRAQPHRSLASRHPLAVRAPTGRLLHLVRKSWRVCRAGEERPVGGFHETPSAPVRSACAGSTISTRPLMAAADTPSWNRSLTRATLPRLPRWGARSPSSRAAERRPAAGSLWPPGGRRRRRREEILYGPDEVNPEPAIRRPQRATTVARWSWWGATSGANDGSHNLWWTIEGAA